jgi:hypothetical protein
MTIDKFNEIYGSKGGIGKLTEMKESLETLKSISINFGVSKERVKQWSVEMFHQKYDPRYERRDRKIEKIRELIKLHGVEKTKELYQGINKHYLKQAIQNT